MTSINYNRNRASARRTPPNLKNPRAKPAECTAIGVEKLAQGEKSIAPFGARAVGPDLMYNLLDNPRKINSL